MSSFSGVGERNKSKCQWTDLLCCCYANVNFSGRRGERKAQVRKREHNSSGTFYHIYLSIYLTMSVLPVLQPLGPKSIENVLVLSAVYRKTVELQNGK